ncbi:MAG: histidine kinase [bacterium]
MALRRHLPIAGFYPLRVAWGLASTWLDQFTRNSPAIAMSVALLTAARLSILPTVHFSLALRLSERFPLSRDMSARAVVYHCLAALALPGVVQVSLLLAWPISRVVLRPQAPSWFVFAQDAGVYLLYVGICQALRSMPSSRAIELARSRLVSAVEDASLRRADAHLNALTTELDSQFLSNALTTLLPLIRTDAAAADRVLARLTDVLGATVGQSRENETTLAEEVQSLDPFIEIERVRLGEQLAVHIDVPDALLDVYVPTLLLQSLFAATAQRLVGTQEPCAIRIAVATTGKRDDLIEIAAWAEGQACEGSRSATNANPIVVAALQACLTELYGKRGRAEVSGEKWAEQLRVTMPCCTADDEPASPAREQHWQRLAASVGRIVIAVATCCMFVWAVASRPMDPRVPVASALVAIVVAAFVVLCASLTAFWLARAHPWVRDPATNRGGGWRAVGVHALASVPFGLFLFVEGVVFGVMVRHYSLSAAKHTGARLSGAVVTMLMVMLLFSGVAHAVEGLKRQRIKDVVLRRLRITLREARRRRAEAELRALTAELNPHFVGNALNAVLMLMRNDRAAAERVLIQLNALLRNAVDRTGMQEVTLREELVTLRPFLAMEGARFGRDLEVKLALDDETLDGQVPHMILQPLVENAVKHGLAPRRGHGRIDIAAHRCDEMLEVIIRNDGIGLADTSPGGTQRKPGVGLANTRARLSELYGDDARLDLTAAADGGTITRLTLPWCARSTERPVRA